ncbi:ABC transporter substrate-binding protein [Bradyrhizobium sp. CCBAU 21359]|uniref:ABC transporter substrate-binding protein n=1 Tax=Bradyrhizobium sp. CCBAU 21359 TaxID=1325080 RepID=UPI0023062D12|nr:ABC transporter substrate-binding protein [Bradyrhizobium sp. CCBAU 21359]
MKRCRGLVLKFLLSLGAAAVLGFPAKPTLAEEKGNIIVGVVLPLTGVLSPYGKPNLEAINLAFDEVNAAGGVNGHKIELVVEDTQASNTTAINALNKVLQSRPVAVIGPGLGTQILALQPVTERAKVTLIGGAGTPGVTKTGAKYYFRDSGNDALDKKGLVSFIINNLKKSKLGIIHVMAEWGYQGRDYLTKELKEQGNLTPVAVASYQSTDKDMTAPVASMIAAGADVVFVQGYPIDESLILKKFIQLGGKATYIASPSTCKAYLRELLTAAEVVGKFCQALDVLPTQNERPEVQKFVVDYKKRTGFPPDMYIAQDYDAAKMLVEIMKERGVERDAIRDGFKTKSYDGILGNYKADEEGTLWHHRVIMRFDENGQANVVVRD